MGDITITQEDWNDIEIDFIACGLMLEDHTLTYAEARKQAIIEWKQEHSYQVQN